MAKKTNSSRGRSSGANGSRSRSTYHDVMSLVGGLLEGQQRNGAEKIGVLANNARKLASDMEDLPHVTAYVEMGADRLDEFAEYVNDTSLEEILSDGAAFAKRNPLPTLGLAAVAGFCAIRITALPKILRRTSARRRQSQTTGSHPPQANGAKRTSATA
jgi:hypothetical protein